MRSTTCDSRSEWPTIPDRSGQLPLSASRSLRRHGLAAGHLSLTGTRRRRRRRLAGGGGRSPWRGRKPCRTAVFFNYVWELPPTVGVEVPVQSQVHLNVHGDDRARERASLTMSRRQRSTAATPDPRRVGVPATRTRERATSDTFWVQPLGDGPPSIGGRPPDDLPADMKNSEWADAALRTGGRVDSGSADNVSYQR